MWVRFATRGRRTRANRPRLWTRASFSKRRSHCGKPKACQQGRRQRGSTQSTTDRRWYSRQQRENEFQMAGVTPRGENAPRITRLLALAVKFEGLIQQGVVKDYAELGRLGQVSRARITQIMNLLNLAPDIQEAILFMTGEGPAEQSLRETSVRTLSAEVIWSRQREQWKKWSAPPSDRRKKRVGAGGDC